jgi:antirestriction protein
MSIEKLEKLKKSLDNKFIPDNMKDKIRAEIKKLESEIKTDETMTAKEVKEEVKEIEEKVEKALEVAEKKEEAQTKAPRKPRQKRATVSRTKKQKSEPKSTAKKKTVFSLAKEIRKDNETWEQAKQRASKMMKAGTTETKKKVRTETSKLLASIRRKKELKNLTGTNIKRDMNRTALPKGKRISKITGKVYYEYRDNRTDRLAPSYKDKIYLAEGGTLPKTVLKKIYEVQEKTTKGGFFPEFKSGYKYEFLVFGNYYAIGIKNNLSKEFPIHYYIYNSNYKFLGGADSIKSKSKIEEYKLTKEDFIGTKFVGYKYADGGTIIGTPETPLARGLDIDYTGLVGETGAMSSGEMFAKGGRLKSALMRDRKYFNKNESWERSYSKGKNRKGYFANGGGIEDNAPSIYVADLEAYNNGKLIGKWFNLLDYSDADELMEAIQEFLSERGAEEYAVHDYENFPSSMYSEYMGKRSFEELYEMIDLAKDNDLPLQVVINVVSEYGASAVDEFMGKYDSADDFAQELVDDTGIESFIDFERYLIVSDTDRRLLAQEMADSYVDDIRDEDGGNRLIEEAGLDVDEYEEADSDRQEEMLDEAREIVYDEYYDTWYDGLSDPYYFLVEEQGLYSSQDFANANFVQIDYEAIAEALEYDYAFIYDDGELYVFNIR